METIETSNLKDLRNDLKLQFTILENANDRIEKRQIAVEDRTEYYFNSVTRTFRLLIGIVLLFVILTGFLQYEIHQLFQIVATLQKS